MALQNHIRTSLRCPQNVDRTSSLELHIRPYGDVPIASAGDVLKTWYTNLNNFVLLNSVRYHDDVMKISKSDWSNLKILMLGRYCKLTSSCVSFTISQQCHGDIEFDVTLT